MSSSTLQDPTIPVKYKLSALWASLMACYIYCDYFEFYTPGKVESLLSGEAILDTPVKLFIASMVLVIPALMICLSILLKALISRALNIIFGILYTLMMLFIGVNSFSPWYAFYVLFGFTESAITAVIVWYAWKWPREGAS